jgi:hypothetical protein
VRKELKEHIKNCYEHDDPSIINIRIVDGFVLETLKCNTECEQFGCIKCKEDITCSTGCDLNKELTELRDALR